MSDPYFNALRLKFGYAITCHKAQGSEWNNVFVKCKTNQNQLTAAYFRWFYTAITRTSQRLWLLDPPSIKVGSGIKPVRPPGIDINPRSVTAPREHPYGNQGADNPAAEDMSRRAVYEGEPLLAACTETSHDDGGLRHVGTESTVEFDTFGIPQSERFLLGILNRVKELLVGSEITIEEINHHQYQEAYTFQRGNDFARIDIGYNSKEKITWVTAPIATEFSVEIQNRLSELVGVPIASAGLASPELISFDEEFLNEFHQRVVPLVTKQGIGIQNVVRQQWNLRYTFSRDNEVAVYDIYFDGKQRFNKCQPLVTACSLGQLVGEVELLLTQGLST